MTSQEYNVEVKQDFIERQAKAPPIPALSELIWNSLDADATQISVELEYDGIGAPACRAKAAAHSYPLRRPVSPLSTVRLRRGR